MENLTLILIGISVLFFVLLGIKSIFKKKLQKLCTICASISLTWILLLVLYLFGKFQDLTIIALLLGGSVVGIFYLWERKTKKTKLIFRLPVMITLIYIAYFILYQKIILGGLILLLIIWVFFILIYSYRNNKSINIFFNKILECCKKW